MKLLVDEHVVIPGLNQLGVKAKPEIGGWGEV